MTVLRRYSWVKLIAAQPGNEKLEMTDQTLKQSVLDELAWIPNFNEAHVGVTARDGVVTLTGHVGSFSEKHEVERAVSRISGVKAIAEEIEIRYYENIGHGDEQIAKQASDVLSWDLCVPKNKVKVLIDKGWVTLRGNVDWYYQKNAAESDVRKLYGVMGVINQIVIEPTIQASDVKKKIAAALERNAELQANGIVVTVDGGKVTLTGEVDSYYERTVAKNTVWSAPGVTHVNDLMTVT